MAGARIAIAPDGERWRVGRQWLDGRARRRFARKPSRKYFEEAADVAWLPDPSGLLDAADSPLAGIALAVAGAVLVGLVVFVLLPLLGIAFELAIAIGFVASSLFGRLVLRRPWTIEAVSLDQPGRRRAFAVTGWRRSRRALSALAAAIESTGPPAALPEVEQVALDPAAPST